MEQDKYLYMMQKMGNSLEFVQSLIKHYSEKYPDRHVFLFLDNMHLVSVPQYRRRQNEI